MRRLIVTLLASWLGLSPAMAQTGEPMRLCLSVSPHGHVGDLRNFAYEGDVRGTDSAPHYGYWVVAIDGGGGHAGGAAWAQNGGAVRGDGGLVRFGVHNGSQYPLAFVVLRAPSAEVYRSIRNSALGGNALTAEQLAQAPRVSALNTCQFSLNGEDIAEAHPSNGNNSCACP